MKKLTVLMRSGVVFASMFFLLQGLALAAGDFKFITTDELKHKMDAGESFLLVDALSPIEFNEMSIKGSVNIPSSRVKAGHPLLPADKGRLIVFYCKGPKCNKSRVAAENATKLGYTNILVYNDGLPGWAQAGLPMDHAVEYPKMKPVRLAPKELHDQLASFVVLDIRGKQHMELGRIKGAINISFDDLDTDYTKLPKGKKIAIVDHAGKQVNIAAKFLHMNGYPDSAVLDGGVLAWLRDGLPVEK